MATMLPSDSDEICINDRIKTKGGHSLSARKEQKRRPKPKDGKVLFCGVCGDRALGYNFDAISCESCKAFFRRNALKVKPFVCSFEGNCVLDAHSRKFCSGCRLQKCFTIGMKKEWILDADQLQKRRQRQQTRRLHQSPSESMDGMCCSSTYEEPMSYEEEIKESSPVNPCHSTSDLVEQMTTFVWSSKFSSSSSQNRGSPPNPNSNAGHIPSSTKSPSSSSSMGESHSPTSTTNNNGVYDPPYHHHQQQHHHHYHPHHHHLYHHEQQQLQQQQQEKQQPTSSSSLPPQSMTPPGPSPPHHHHNHHQQQQQNAPISFIYDTDSSSAVDTTNKHAASSSMSKNNVSQFDQDIDIKKDIVSASEFTTHAPLKRPSSCDIFEEEEMQIQPLNPYIRENLDIISEKYKEVFDKPYNSEDTVKLMKQPKTMDQLYNMTDMFIRRLIRFTKCIAEFRGLTADDQIGLLKGGIMELFVLRSCVSFDSKGGSFKFQTQIKTETGEMAVQEGGVKNSIMNPMGSSMFKNQMSVVHAIQELTGQDLTILILIFIIHLMDPNRPNITNNKLIAEAQERHLTWLKAYLRSKHDGPKTRYLLVQLLEKMKEVQELGKASCEMLVNVEIDRLEPILVEIFDLGA